jgi:hypothetical protein
MPVRTRSLLPFALAALVGCGRSPAEPTASAPPAPRLDVGARFDPATAGTIRGQVLWLGDVPAVAKMTAALPDGSGGYRWAEMPNPFAPVVDENTRGLAGAVVYLKGIDPAAGRPWDLPPVRVEMRDFQIRVRQGDGEPRAVGFVRRGDEVEVVSNDHAHHMLRARGAAYITLPFPDPDKPLLRRFDSPGVVELTSGAGYFWAAADLFVDDHQYYAVTDREGRFTLPAVPPGSYDLVCRVRSWHTAGRDRDPETGLIARLRFAAPVEKRAALTVAPKQTAEQSFNITAADFPANPER